MLFHPQRILAIRSSTGTPYLSRPEAFLVTNIVLSYSVALQFRYIIYAFQDMKRLAITDFLGQATKVVISPILIFLGFKYFGPIVGFLFGLVLVIVSRIWSIPLKGRPVKINEKAIMFTYALPAFIISMGWLIFTNGQYVLLTALQNPAVTGLYTVGLLLTSILVVVPTTLNSALLPITSQLSVERDSENRRGRLIQSVLRYSILVTLPLAVVLFLFSETAILLFSRAEYLSASKFFPLLIVGSVIYGLGGIFQDSIYAIGKPKANRNIVIIMTLVFLILAFPLIYLFSAMGAATAYTISATLLTILSYMYLKKHVKLTIPYSSVIKVMFSIIVSFGSLYLILGVIENLLLRVFFASLSFLIYLVILLPLKFYTKDDIKILDFIAKKIPIIKDYNKILQNLIKKFVG